MVKKYHVLFCMMIGVYYLNGIEKVSTLEWNAQNYEMNSAFQSKVAEYALSKIQFNGDEHILDIGCGNGKITAILAQKVPLGSVRGIDIAEYMLLYANNNYVLPNLFFGFADATDFLSLIPADFVVAFSVIAWIENQVQALRNIEKALKPGGIFIATMDNDDDPYLRARYAMFTHDMWKNFFKDYKVPYYPFNEDKIRSLLHQAGFVNITIQKMVAPSMYVTKDEFIGMLRAIPAQKDMIPEGRHIEFFDDIVSEYVKEVPLSDEGNIELIFTEFIVTAEKRMGL